MTNIPALLKTIRDAFQIIATGLALTAYEFPSTTVVPPGGSYDYIVVGGGTAGCIIATRLAVNTSNNILMIEYGGDPPIQSKLTGTIVVNPNSDYDFKYTTVNDNRTAQYTRNKNIQLTAGKLLGGSSSILHGILVGGNKLDYDDWASIINDESWNFENMLPYMKKPEKMVEKDILESEYGDLYGTNGPVTLTQDHENVTDKYFDALQEIGLKKVVDINGHSMGYAEPVFYISKNGNRQSTAETYLKRAKTLTNLHVMKNTEVTKIMFDNRNAIGVTAKNESGEFEIYSSKEVILTAGALNTPKLLMLSGIGPREHLEKLGIDVLADLPVGKNLHDLTTVLFEHKMESSNETKEPRDPHKYAAPAIVGYGAFNESLNVTNYLTLSLMLEHDSTDIKLLTSALFNFNDDIVETFYNASMGHKVLLTALSPFNLTSKGTVELRSTNSSDPPVVNLNLLSNDEDITKTAKCLQHFAKIQNTTYFQSVNAEFVNLNVGCGTPNNSLEFWKCYAVAVSNTFWQYVGTCALGSVVDAELRVIGIGNLRVADASVIPKIIGGYENMPVMAIAEKAADMIMPRMEINNCL